MEQIALALFTCLILAIVSKSLSLPPIPFYILAGILLGNSGLKIISADEVLHFFSQLGLIFLLFYIGLELKPKRLVSRGSAFLIAGFIDLNVNMLLGFFVALALGFSYYEAFVVASAFYISSSAMVIASLIENKKLILPESETVVWLMIFEDIVLAFLIFIISTGLQHPFVLILKIIAVVCLLFAIVKFVKQSLLKILQRDDELPVILTFSAVLSAAFISRYLNIPEVLTVIALGSALSTTNPKAFERISRPFKDVFLVLFFFFFGISIDFSGNLSLMQALIISFIAIVSKLFSGFIVGRTLHKSYSAGIEIGANTITRGEFSIAIAAIYGSEIVSATVTAMVISTSIVGSFMAKYSSKIKASLKKLGISSKP
jgi:CPA2 family monovalent cation:H+ antiporter-2